ncbi:MAG: uroporphyrinogen decarboxylase family protein [Candidatus Hodarchaeota archaeon]
MMENYDRFSLLKATFKGQKAEKVPYALWKHFPEADKTSEGLARAQIEYQAKFKSDLMKISPHGSYCVVDFGATLGNYNPISGSRICEQPPISSINDWETLEPVDPNDGEFGAQIKAVELIHREVENVIPTMMTVFSPFMVAAKLDPSLLKHLMQDRQLLLGQISMLTKLTSEFANAVLDAGANGLFLATQHFNPALPKEEIQDFEFQPMKIILQNVTKKVLFNIMHLHGENPHFKWATQLPNISGINWHDQRTAPSLQEARQDFKGALLGGLDEMNLIRKGSKDDIQHSIKTLFKKFNDRGLIYAPGCVLPLDVPEQNLQYVIETVNSLVPI